MFSARKSKAAAPRQPSVAPQIERTATGSSLDDSNESSRRGDVALCCAYVLQGSDWAPVNNSRPDDLSGESRFLAAKIVQDEDKFRSAVEKLLHKRASRRLRSAAQLAKRRFFEPLDFAKLERKELQPPFTPRAGRVPNVPDQNLVKKFGPHRPSDGDSPQQKGGSDEVSLSFKGEQFQGFSVFASPAPPVRRKSSKDLK